MIKDNPEERPTCLEILEEKNLWALNEQDFDFLNEWNAFQIHIDWRKETQFIRFSH